MMEPMMEWEGKRGRGEESLETEQQQMETNKFWHSRSFKPFLDPLNAS
jgi:hypothetical protein